MELKEHKGEQPVLRELKELQGHQGPRELKEA